jgi:hypothetical protein
MSRVLSALDDYVVSECRFCHVVEFCCSRCGKVFVRRQGVSVPAHVCSDRGSPPIVVRPLERCRVSCR